MISIPNPYPLPNGKTLELDKIIDGPEKPELSAPLSHKNTGKYNIWLQDIKILQQIIDIDKINKGNIFNIIQG
jgi:hypothetical protein